MEIIALSGWARSGKDTIADHLVEKHGFVKLSFATPMREALYRLNPEIRDISGLVYGFRQAVNLFGWEDMKTYFPEYRGLMQRMGTEVGRELFGENFWVEQAFKQIPEYSKVVFADCRYQNEASAVRDVGGEIWRISKPEVEAANDHTSEHDLNNYTFDSYVFNISTIEELKRIVDDKYSTIRRS